MVKNPSDNAGDLRDACSIPRLGRSPWRRAWQPIPVFLPEKSHGQRSLVGYSPKGHKNSDTTEHKHGLEPYSAAIVCGYENSVVSQMDEVPTLMKRICSGWYINSE